MTLDPVTDDQWARLLANARAAGQTDREYFPQLAAPLLVVDVQVLKRLPEHAPTLAEAIRALCDGHGDAT